MRYLLLASLAVAACGGGDEDIVDESCAANQICESLPDADTEVSVHANVYTTPALTSDRLVTLDVQDLPVDGTVVRIVKTTAAFELKVVSETANEDPQFPVYPIYTLGDPGWCEAELRGNRWHYFAASY